MKTVGNLKVSALNLVPIREGQSDKQAIEDMISLAQKLDSLNYERYWIAEHHNAPNLVSSATSLLIQHTLEHTKRIKVGSRRDYVTKPCSSNSCGAIWNNGNTFPKQS